MKALRIAAHLGCQRIGIPALSAGPDKFPLRKGARIIFNALRDSSLENFETVEIVCKSPDAYQAYRERFA
jgi:O-acetyl-ADP-ribose deacetylase (regulator of RNase III)